MDPAPRGIPAMMPERRDEPAPAQQAPIDDDAIRALVVRLSRPHASGGAVIERAAILAAGPDSAAVLAWITAHAGEAEEQIAPRRAAGGLHGARAGDASSATRRAPLRYVLPADALR